MISVIIPLYNKLQFVERTLKSVFAQTYSDFEVIIVDDGSNDGSAELVEQLINGHDNIKLIRQTNSGVGAARNHGVAESKSDYLCFLDADDWWKPTFLEEMAAFVDKYPDAGLYATNYIYYKPGKTRIGLKCSTGYINYPKTYYETGAMPITSITACIPRSVFLSTGGFPKGIKLGEDFLLWSKIAIEHKVAFLDKPLAFYNNEIPPSKRATRNLYAPEHHMLWNLDDIEERASRTEEAGDWRCLFDSLRNNGLLEYWLDHRFHDLALKELQKINGTLSPIYSQPIWLVKTTQHVKRFGSIIKQMLIR